MKLTICPNSDTVLIKDWKYYYDLINIVSNNHLVSIIGLKKHNEYNNVIDLRGKTNIPELIEVIKKSHLIICNEGGVNHISSYYNIPCIVTQMLDTPYRCIKSNIINLYKPKISEVLKFIDLYNCILKRK